MSEILAKALKFKNAMDKGDIQIKELATTKYNNYLIDNDLNTWDVENYQKLIEGNGSGKVIEIKLNGQIKIFKDKDTFTEWYLKLSFVNKFKIAPQVLKQIKK